MNNQSAGQDSEINVVTGADEAYALPLATMLHSLLSNVKERASVNVYLMDGGFTSATRRRLTRLAKQHDAVLSLAWMVPDVSTFADLPTLPYLSPVTYARLLLPDLFPNLDRVIYLDADVVVQEDVTDLWQTELNGAPLGAVQDFGVPTVGAAYGIRAYEDLGLDTSQEYFNAGVLLLDLTAWRDQGLSERAVTYLTDYADELRIADQEALNVAVQDRWHRLNPKWNLTTEFFDARPASRPVSRANRGTGALNAGTLPDSAAIVHYTSASKPWTPDCDHPLRHLFQDALHRSGWLTLTQQFGWRARYWLGRAWRSARVHARPLRRHVSVLSRRRDKFPRS
jgi:lipopolysaccharide biosynthesis glycosyltransferase